MNGPNSEYIKGLFSSISTNYDLANDVMTFGLARLWRKKLVKWSGCRSGDSVLDCATGTGDLAFAFKKRVGVSGKVIGTDFCDDMLQVAGQKQNKKRINVGFQWADATNLKFQDDSFDIVSISYGIRNVDDTNKALSEMARVTQPGGCVMILETGDPKNAWIEPLIKLHFKVWVPLMGGLISGQKSAYDYLNQSSSQFPCADDMVKLMMDTGKFAKVEYKSLMGGASYIYKGTVH